MNRSDPSESLREQLQVLLDDPSGVQPDLVTQLDLIVDDSGTGAHAVLLWLMTQLTFDDGGRTVLGTPPEAAAVTLDALQAAVEKCGRYRIAYRLRAANGRVHHVVEEGAAVTAETAIGRPISPLATSCCMRSING